MPVSLAAVGVITKVVMIGAARVLQAQVLDEVLRRRLADAGREAAGVEAEERIADQVGDARAAGSSGLKTTIAYLSEGISVCGSCAVVERHREGRRVVADRRARVAVEIDVVRQGRGGRRPAAALPWRSTKMFCERDGRGVERLAERDRHGPAADVVVVIVGEVVSARVNVIGPEATRSLPSSDSTGPLAGLWIENV